MKSMYFVIRASIYFSKFLLFKTSIIIQAVQCKNIFETADISKNIPKRVSEKQGYQTHHRIIDFGKMKCLNFRMRILVLDHSAVEFNPAQLHYSQRTHAAGIATNLREFLPIFDTHFANDFRLPGKVKRVLGFLDQLLEHNWLSE